MTKIYVIKETYEKNASDGISYYTNLDDLAQAVHSAEICGASVQVFKCVPVEHNVYPSKLMIDLQD
jgi:hypothetical protein